MKKTIKSELSLTAERIKQLSATALARVAGGYPNTAIPGSNYLGCETGGQTRNIPCTPYPTNLCATLGGATCATSC